MGSKEEEGPPETKQSVILWDDTDDIIGTSSDTDDKTSRKQPFRND